MATDLKIINGYKRTNLANNLDPDSTPSNTTTESHVAGTDTPQKDSFKKSELTAPKDVPFRGISDDDDDEPSLGFNKTVLLVGGLALAAVLGYVFRKPLGIEKLLKGGVKEAEKATESEEKLADKASHTKTKSKKSKKKHKSKKKNKSDKSKDNKWKKAYKKLEKWVKKNVQIVEDEVPEQTEHAHGKHGKKGKKIKGEHPETISGGRKFKIKSKQKLELSGKTGEHGVPASGDKQPKRSKKGIISTENTQKTKRKWGKSRKIIKGEISPELLSYKNADIHTLVGDNETLLQISVKKGLRKRNEVVYHVALNAEKEPFAIKLGDGPNILANEPEFKKALRDLGGPKRINKELKAADSGVINPTETEPKIHINKHAQTQPEKLELGFDATGGASHTKVSGIHPDDLLDLVFPGERILRLPVKKGVLDPKIFIRL